MTKVSVIQWQVQVFLFLLALLAVASAQAAGSAAAGKDKARACQVCHGKGGVSSNPTYPILAGQHAKYLVKQLKAFRSGTRKDPIMNGIAAKMSDQDMEDVAAFFESSQSGFIRLR